MSAHIDTSGVPAARRSGPDRADRGAEVVAVAAEVLGHLADPTRLHLLRLLAAGEHDVTALTAAVPASRSSVSQHLARLRLAGLVTVRRQGRHMHYRISSDHLAALVEEVCQYADHELRGVPHHRAP
jgi:DNA-binding transcriptional ArsR family regulator